MMFVSTIVKTVLGQFEIQANMDANKHIIIEHGTNIKGGFVGEKMSAIFPALCSRPMSQLCFASAFQTNLYLCGEGLGKKGVHQHRSTVKNGIINLEDPPRNYKDWDPYVDIYHTYCHILQNELRIDPQEHSTVFLYAIGTPMTTLERICKMAFEDIAIPAILITNPLRTTLLSTGKTTGTVIECGAQLSQVACFVNSHYTPYVQTCMNGDDITRELMNLLNHNGYSFSWTSHYDREVVDDMKTKMCCIAQNNDGQVESKTYELPDGNMVMLQNERTQAPEILFSKKFNYSKNVQDAILDAWAACTGVGTFKQAVKSDVVFGGGTTRFSGFGDRLTTELNKCVNFDVTVTDADVAYVKYSAWYGASMLASTNTDEWMTKEQYDEMGPIGLVHRVWRSMQYVDNALEVFKNRTPSDVDINFS
jgi:centractin